ncbi:MAG: hypothetical protein J7M38_15595, partial [Armatimonadetes bacterium]|nr:hypothetical protein [Armatimonadota bacterium]
MRAVKDKAMSWSSPGAPPMTHRERILAALQGRPVDRLPWVPRLDLWYNANRYCGTLPREWADASLPEIIADLGVGRHEVIPDFLDTEHPDEGCDRALGIEHCRNQPYRLRFRRTERIVERSGDELRVTWRTPVGEVSAKLLYTEQMRRDGVTLMHVSERVVKRPEDYDIIGFIFEDLEVVTDGGRYGELRDEVGDTGIAVAYCNVAASPVHHLLKELVPYDQFYYDLHDRPEIILRTAERMTGYFDAVVDACAESDAEVVLFGANYDVSLTTPPIFAEHIAPTLTRVADRLHAAGKLLATHTDGENDGLLHFYGECGVDMADSVCPAPMTRLPLAEYRREFGTRPAIWGGICSVSVLDQAMTDEEFEAHLDDVIGAVGDGRGMIFSIADTTPPDASLARIRRIGERLRA